MKRLLLYSFLLIGLAFTSVPSNDRDVTKQDVAFHVDSVNSVDFTDAFVLVALNDLADQSVGSFQTVAITQYPAGDPKEFHGKVFRPPTVDIKSNILISFNSTGLVS